MIQICATGLFAFNLYAISFAQTENLSKILQKTVDDFVQQAGGTSEEFSIQTVAKDTLAGALPFLIQRIKTTGDVRLKYRSVAAFVTLAFQGQKEIIHDCSAQADSNPDAPPAAIFRLELFGLALPPGFPPAFLPVPPFISDDGPGDNNHSFYGTPVVFIESFVQTVPTVPPDPSLPVDPASFNSGVFSQIINTGDHASILHAENRAGEKLIVPHVHIWVPDQGLPCIDGRTNVFQPQWYLAGKRATVMFDQPDSRVSRNLRMGTKAIFTAGGEVTAGKAYPGDTLERDDKFSTFVWHDCDLGPDKVFEKALFAFDWQAFWTVTFDGEVHPGFPWVTG